MKYKTIRVTEETHTQLMKLVDEYYLSANDVIIMCLELMKNSNIIIDSKAVNIVVNGNRRIDYLIIKKAFEKGVDVFISDINNRKAISIKRTIKDKLGYSTTVLVSESDGKNGFLFMRSL